MILQALVDYYETLAKAGEIPRPGWGKAKVSHALELDENGTLLAIYPLAVPDETGKKLRPREMELPSAVKRAMGIDPNFLWDNAGYLLGVDGKGKPQRTAQCFSAAAELHCRLLGALDDPYAKAICGFFGAWQPETAREHPAVAPYLSELEAGGNLVFLLRDTYPTKNAALAAAWQNHYDGGSDGDTLRCLVTGQNVVPQAIHPSVKGVRGAQSSGAALVSFNASAYCSYGRKQNLNAPVGKYAAFAYTTALNHLLADRGHVKQIGDTTVVFWAESGETQYQDAFSQAMDMQEDNTVRDEDLKAMLNKLAAGAAADWNGFPLKPDNRFYVLGLAPNAARISVRFFLRDTFGEMTRNLKAHYDRLEIVKPALDKWDTLPLWMLLRETVNPNARDKAASPQMAGDTLRAILTGGRYPATFFQGLQVRIRADRKVGRTRAAIIKAYLMRNIENEQIKEVTVVALNEKSNYPPYVLGRLFAVLEEIQEKANPGINTTITDKYFSSASTIPGTVFPTLVDLAKKHLRKLEPGSKVYCSKKLGDLLDILPEKYPKHLNLEEKGSFQLGYYHQNQKRYEKKTD